MKAKTTRRAYQKARRLKRKPAYRKPRRDYVPKPDAGALVDAYLAWAHARGPTSVAVYDTPDARYTVEACERHGLAARLVPVAEFIGPAPAGEEE